MRFLTAGESHGREIVAIVEGLPAGIDLRAEEIDRDLTRRQSGYGRGARSTRIERDRVDIVSGLAGGRTTGAPLAIRIDNRDFANQPANPPLLTTPRPGHADLAGRLKYGLWDFRTVRERASARETAARVAVGAVGKTLLGCFGSSVGSFVLEVGTVRAELSSHDHGISGPMAISGMDAPALHALAAAAEEDPMRTPDQKASALMRAEVDKAKAAGSTLGGLFCVFATGVPAGLGSYVQWDRKLDGRLAQAVCSIHAVKGVEIGPAFDLARLSGTEAQDSIGWRDGAIVRGSNRAGGLEGGVTNGEPILLTAAMKPLSSVRAAMESVDFETASPADPPHVRSDVCAVPAAAVVGEAMMAWVLAEAITDRFGSDRLDGMLAAREAVAEADLPGTVATDGADASTPRRFSTPRGSQ